MDRPERLAQRDRLARPGAAASGWVGGRGGLAIYEPPALVLGRRETSQEEVHVGLDVVDRGVDACLGDPIEDGRPEDDQQEHRPEEGLDHERRVDLAKPRPGRPAWANQPIIIGAPWPMISLITTWASSGSRAEVRGQVPDQVGPTPHGGVVGAGDDDQTLARRQVYRRLDLRPHLVDRGDAPGHRAQQLAPVGEMVVDRALGQARFGGDRLDRGEAAAGPREDANGCLDEAVAGEARRRPKSTSMPSAASAARRPLALPK